MEENNLVDNFKSLVFSTRSILLIANKAFWLDLEILLMISWVSLSYPLLASINKSILSASDDPVNAVSLSVANEQKELWSKEIINENFKVFRLRNNGYFHGSRKSSNLERIKSFCESLS